MDNFGESLCGFGVSTTESQISQQSPWDEPLQQDGPTPTIEQIHPPTAGERLEDGRGVPLVARLAKNLENDRESTTSPECKE